MITLLLCAAMLLGLVPGAASAAWQQPEIQIAWGGGNVSWNPEGEAMPNLPAGVTYTPETHTLSLQGASLTRLAISGFGNTPVTIQVQGDNTIAWTLDQACVPNPAALEITGCNHVTFTGGGTLHVKSLYSGSPILQTDIAGGIAASSTFVAEGAYFSYDVASSGPGTLEFNNVTVDVENQLQQSALFPSGDSALLQGSGGNPAELMFSRISLTNHASLALHGQREATLYGSVDIGAGCSLIADGIAFGGMMADPDAPATVTVKGTLQAGTRTPAIESHRKLIQGQYADLTCSSGHALFVDPTVSLLLDGGEISSIASLYTEGGIEISGSTEVRSGTMSVSVLDADIPERERDWTCYSRISGIRIDGSLRQTGGKITVDFSAFAVPHVECRLLDAMDGAEVELNRGTMDLRLPRQAYEVVGVGVNGEVFTCSGTNITVSGDNNGSYVMVTAVEVNEPYGPDSTPAAFRFSGGSLAVKAAGPFSVTALEVDGHGVPGGAIQITGGTITADLTASSGFGIAAVGDSTLTVSGGTMDFRFNGNSSSMGIETYGTDVVSTKAVFSGGKISIQTVGEAEERYRLDGINCAFSAVTITGQAEIDIASSNVPGITFWANTTAEISGGTVRINQKTANPKTVGIYVEHSTLAFTGGEVYAQGSPPLKYANQKTRTPVTFGTGITPCVLRADGTASQMVSFSESPYYDGVAGNAVDPTAADPNAPFHMVVRRQSGGSPAQGSPSGFSDVEAGAWYRDAVDYAVQRGLMSGVGNGRFAPGQDTNRAMLATILYNLEGKPPVSGASPFADVKRGAYYADAVAWAHANQVVSGISKTQFGPDQAITREQLVTMLYNYARLKGYSVSKTGGLSGFADGDAVSSWARTAMGWATANGIMGGSGAGSALYLHPKDNTSRAEMAAFIMNFLTAFVP